jgi:hypothetical protein
MAKHRYGRGRGRRGPGSKFTPGSLVYFGGAVHEVLANGSYRERPELVPGSPRRLWKPKYTRRARAAGSTKTFVPVKSSRRKRYGRRRKRPSKWIQAAKLKRGSLHRQLGIPMGQKIPISLLRQAAKAPGVLGHRARLALVFHKIRRRKARSK